MADGAVVHLSYPPLDADRGVDFQGPDTVTLGVSLTQFVVDIIGDTVFEPNESFKIRIDSVDPPLSPPMVIGPGTVDEVTITIQNDDYPGLTVTALGASPLDEGDPGDTVTADFEIKLDGTPPSAVNVVPLIDTGLTTARPVDDYDSSALPTSLVFSDGNPQTIQVPIVSDFIEDPQPTATLTLKAGYTPPVGPTFSDLATLTINDDDGAVTPVASVVDVTFAESDGASEFVVTFTPALTVDTPISWFFTDGTGTSGAVSPADYSTPGNSGTANGSTFPIPVTINDDFDAEANEFFSLTVQFLGQTTVASGSILDNDQSFIQISNAEAFENDLSGFVTFNVVLSQGAPNNASFEAQVSGGTAQGDATLGIDFNPPTPAIITVPQGASSATVQVPIIDDVIADEVDEVFQVSLVNLTNLLPGSQTSATGTIRENDVSGSSATLRIGDASVGESDEEQQVTLEVTLDPAQTQTVTVQWATRDGSATSPLDYIGASGGLSFAPGETTAEIQVTVNGDQLEESIELFEVELLLPDGAILLDALGSVVITDDDQGGGDPVDPPGDGGGDPTALPLVSIDDLQVVEGNAGMTSAVVEATIAGAHTEAVQVGFFTREVGSATAGGADQDFQTRSDLIEFPAGVNQMSFSIQILGDTRVEADEMFEVVLENPVGLSIGDGIATVLILNDDNDLPMIDVTMPDTVSEGGNSVPIRLTLDGPAAGTVSARVRAEPMTARAGEDFVARTATVEWSAGQSGDRTVRIPLVDDAILARVTSPSGSRSRTCLLAWRRLVYRVVWW